MKIDQAFGVHEDALRLRTRRSEVLAGNLANADTPGFKARDFDFGAVLRREMPGAVQLAATHAAHVRTDGATALAGPLQYRNPDHPSLDGNTVDVAREQVEFSANSMQYQASLRFLDGKIRSLLSAIRGD
ncbi:MAG: flagellar basal body rod protein FlgB [Gammaproteobacteria bacterium]|jgi:flagellar basal-body rod protein FlgB|nr:flagellar basal body rod protein FlgB [Gammaproteobacteria bacterium]